MTVGTTVASLRTNYLNSLLGRSDAQTQPWTDTECNTAITDALLQSWPDVGKFVTGDVATSKVNEYSLPAAFDSVDGNSSITRIDVLDSSGNYIDQLTNFRRIPGGKFVTKPQITTGYTLRVTGFTAFKSDATDLPDCEWRVIADLAASIAWSMLGGKLVNYQRQQGVDSARVVTAQEATALSSYFRALWNESVKNDPYRTVAGGRRARR